MSVTNPSLPPRDGYVEVIRNGTPAYLRVITEEYSMILDAAARAEENELISSIAFVTLAEAGQLDDVTATEHSGRFTPWVVPFTYTAGNIRRHNRVLYRCVQSHTSQDDWPPDLTPALWVRVGDPAEEWPAWSQPVGAHDAYDKDAKVSHKGGRWISNLAANVWEPGVCGWSEITS